MLYPVTTLYGTVPDVVTGSICTIAMIEMFT